MRIICVDTIGAFIDTVDYAVFFDSSSWNYFYPGIITLTQSSSCIRSISAPYNNSLRLNITLPLSSNVHHPNSYPPSNSTNINLPRHPQSSSHPVNSPLPPPSPPIIPRHLLHPPNNFHNSLHQITLPPSSEESSPQRRQPQNLHIFMSKSGVHGDTNGIWGVYEQFGVGE